jgi:hypothetical protein
MDVLEYLKREWPGILTWAIAIWFGIEGFKAFDPQTPVLFVISILAVSVFALAIAALGLAVRQAVEGRRLRAAGR